MKPTRLSKLKINNFRALSDVTIDIGNHITVICGKNGTSKSSILGISAQIFNFKKNYLTNKIINHKTISNEIFKSQPQDHFRFSNIFDTPGSLSVDIELFDGYTQKSATGNLELMKRTVAGETVPRPVVRNNSTVQENDTNNEDDDDDLFPQHESSKKSKTNKSRSFTHPVIYLSLKRLQPISFREYKENSNPYLINHRKTFLEISNKLLNKNSSLATSTSGSIYSAAAHSENYNHDSVSTGEENVGQIALAIMSFEKLKAEYPDYKGGLLLIDEADAALFPAAQIALIDVLAKYCKELQLQVIMTSHSPTLIEHIYKLSQEKPSTYKTIYLSDTLGDVRSMENISWQDIHADLLIKTIRTNKGNTLPKINTYFEDKEAFDFFKILMSRSSLNAALNTLENVTLGCSNYINLIQKGVPEFARLSIIVLDSDAATMAHGHKTVCTLPGRFPPDQLIFEHLYNLPATDDFWNNSIKFTKPVFLKCAQEITNTFNISEKTIDLARYLQEYKKTNSKEKSRDIFKRFYKTEDFQEALKLTGLHNPWRHWIKHNSADAVEFKELFKQTFTHVMTRGFAVEQSKISLLK